MPTASPLDVIDGLAVLISRLAQEMGIRLERLLDRMAGMDDRQRLTFITAVFPEFMRAYLGSAALASGQVYDELPAPPEAASFIPDTSILIPDEVLAIKGRIAILAAKPLVVALRSTGDQMLYRQSRLTMVTNAQLEGVKWYRYASANACGWCRMLATRGAVYGSEEAAASSHPNCHCMAVPLRLGEDYDAAYAERVRQWAADYEQARKDGAQTPAQIANAMDKLPGGRRHKSDQSDILDLDKLEPETAPGTDGPKGPGSGDRTGLSDFGDDELSTAIDHGWDRHAPGGEDRLGTRHPAGTTRQQADEIFRDIAAREWIAAPPGPVDGALKARLDAGEVTLVEPRSDHTNLYGRSGDVRYQIRLGGKNGTAHPIDGQGVVRKVRHGVGIIERELPIGSRPIEGWDRPRRLR